MTTPAVPTGRTPPHDLDAEEAVLGACLLSIAAIDTAIDAGLTADHFYKPAHGHIYAAVLQLRATGDPVDTRIVAATLTRDGLLDQIGGPTTLLGLQANAGATSEAYVAKYSSIVIERSLLRRLIGAAGEIADLGYSLPDDVTSALDDAEQRIYRIADSRATRQEIYPVADLVAEHLELIDARVEGTVTLGPTTGIHDLDTLIGGLGRGQLIVLAGRPGMAKTVTALGFAVSAAAAAAPAMFVSIEMPRRELMDRLFSSVSRVDMSNLRLGELTERDWPRLMTGVGRVTELPLAIVDDPSVTIAKIRSAARRAARTGLQVLVVDYLQIINVKGGGDRRVDVDEISRGLKNIARELDVAVVVCCQLNRNVEGRADKRPQLSDLRESGQIEQDADVVIGLYRDDYYHPDSADRGVIELLVLKQRNGPAGVVRAAFLDRIQTVANMVAS